MYLSLRLLFVSSIYIFHIFLLLGTTTRELLPREAEEGGKGEGEGEETKTYPSG
jgi:hypothetical protein